MITRKDSEGNTYRKANDGSWHIQEPESLQWTPPEGRLPLSELLQREPNPERAWAQAIPEIGMGLATGGTLNLASRIPWLIRHSPMLAKSLGYLGGALTKPASFTQAASGGAVEGGITEAVRPDSTLSSVAEAVTTGAVAAGVADKVIKGFNPSKDAEKLLDKGVDLTLGARLGEGAKHAEEAFLSVPGLGSVVKNAKKREQDSFNQMLIDDALFPIGGILPPSTAPGAESMAEASRQIKNQYNTVLGNMTVKPDAKFIDDIANLLDMAKQLPEKEAAQFDKIIKSQIGDQLDKTDNLFLGQTYKKVYSKLRTDAARYKKSPDGYQQDLGHALDATRAALREAGERQNPEQAKLLTGADKAYAKYKVISKAAKSLGAEDRNFNATQYLNAVAKSTDESRFVTGQGYNQDLAEAAKNVMSQKLNDSGTASRMLANSIFMGGGFAYAPQTIPMVAAGMAGYTKKGQNILNSALMATPGRPRLGAAGLVASVMANTAAKEDEKDRIETGYLEGLLGR